jgi:hypothetical protein
MNIINPHDYSTTAPELRRFSSEISINCNPDYLGWKLRAGFAFKDHRPQRYFDVYLALGQFVRATTGPDPYTPKRIL